MSKYKTVELEKNIAFKFLLFIHIFIFHACAVHNNPQSVTPNELIEKNVITVFVDQDGTFYPDNWEAISSSPPKSFFPLEPRRKSYSLYYLAKEKELIILGEEKVLQDVKHFTQGKKKVYILVHGYNKSEPAAKMAYQAIRKNIASADDVFIDFYWDGLNTTTGILGSITSWFPALGYSSMAGEFGLRRILNQISDCEVVIFSHSRGASVLLSSLSNPPYDPDFFKDVNQIRSERKIYSGPQLKNNNNRIRLILLAPAVGEVDFYKSDKKELRDFDSQLISIHITVNEQDSTLKKFIHSLSEVANAPSLGENLELFEKLDAHYNIFSYTLFNMNSHDFHDYITNKRFFEVLKVNGIPQRE